MSAESPATSRPLGEISQEPAALEQFLDRHQKLIIALVVLAILAIAAYTIYNGIKKDKEHDAGMALSQAGDLASLQKIVQDFPATVAAGSAKVLLADKMWNEGQQDPAVSTLKDFIASAGDHPALPTAQASLGSKLASQGKNDEASQVFEKLAANESGRYLAPFALLSLGDIAKSTGDLAKAESYYQRAQNEFPESTFGNTATRRIGLLKAKPPTEIEPPPAPPATPAPSAGPGAPSVTIPAPAAPETAPAPAPQAPAVPAPAPTAPDAPKP